MQADLLIENIAAASMDPALGTAYGLIENAVLLVRDGKILWLGERARMPACDARQRFDAAGAVLTPGLIDCHTHLVYGGNRALEFEARCAGVPYEQIAREGGGIRRTVEATRAADEPTLLRSALQRLDSLRREGVTTIEIKSGYGLDLDSELRMLRVARQLARERPVHVCTTLLAAHAVAPEFGGDTQRQVDFACEQLIPAACAAQLADAVDVFCEGIAFSVAQCRQVFAAAQAAGLPIKAHAEQLSNIGGARAAAECGALSVDHLEYLAPEDVETLRAAGTVAVLLPGAFYFLRETHLPPVAALRAAGVPMAVASDLNPGSSPMASLLLAMNQSCVLFGLTPEEALRGATVAAAQALGLQERKGLLRAGMDADLLLWDIGHPREISYGIALVRPYALWQGGDHVALG